MNSISLFAFETPNLGDEMQSLAVLAHLDRIDQFVDRDRLADYTGPRRATCVFNSWFFNGNDFRPPSSLVAPVWHGFAARPDLPRGAWLDYLRSQGTIGCRDLATTQLLRDAGVEADWVGCLTLFLGAALPQGTRGRQGIYFLDVPPEAEAFIPREIVDRAIRLSTFPPPGLQKTLLRRWAALARLVDVIAHAELVVTRRLHIALPAASFGTPVVAIPDQSIALARRRFAGFDRILPTVFLDELEAGLQAIDWTHVPVASIPDSLAIRYQAFRDQLRRQGLSSERHLELSPLDDSTRHTYRIQNVEALDRPSHVRLTLADRSFELDVALWSDRFVDVMLSGFPGLAKIDFQVEVRREGSGSWRPWGRLRDLLIADDIVPDRRRPPVRRAPLSKVPMRPSSSGSHDRVGQTALEDLVLQQRTNIWIWGTGSAGRRLLAHLRGLGVEPAGFIDGGTTPPPNPVEGVPTYAAVEANDARHADALVLIASAYASDILQRVQADGDWRSTVAVWARNEF